MNAAQLRTFLLTIQDMPSIVDAVNWDAFDKLAAKHGLEINKFWLADIEKRRKKFTFDTWGIGGRFTLKEIGDGTVAVEADRGVVRIASSMFSRAAQQWIDHMRAKYGEGFDYKEADKPCK